MPRVDEQRLYDELISLCYECVLDEAKWPELVQRLIHASGRQQGGLMCSIERDDFVQVSEVNFFNREAVEPYNQHFCHLDPGHLFMPQRAVGNWYHDFIDYGLDAIKRHAYYQDFHRIYGLGRISTIKLYETPTSNAYLSVLTNWDARIPSTEQQNLLNRISTHLIAAGRVSVRLQRLEQEVAKRDLLLDNHHAPVWLLDGDGHVLHCNQAAMRCLCQANSPLHERFSRLQSKYQDASLKELIRRATGKGGRRQAGWLRLLPQLQQELLATPVPADASVNRSLQRPLVMLVLLDNQPSIGLLADLFQLSPAEQRLAELLAQQLSPESCATCLGVSINTVRTQLRALFRKTGTSRQSELASLIGRLSN